MSNFYLSSTNVAETISKLVARNKLWAKKRVRLYFIVNSTAGCFNNKQISKSYFNLFMHENREIEKNKSCVSYLDYKIYETQYPGHATELAQKIITEIIESKNNITDNIIVTAGGDGTSLEVQTALYHSPLLKNETLKKIGKTVAILRLPLGTGNDGTDGHFIEESFDLLKSGIIYSDSKILVASTENNPPEDTIKKSNTYISRFCDVSHKSPWYSFNIASIGLDAFVAFTTNLIKSKIPGNIYHLCVPLSGLFYDRVFKPGNIKIEMYNSDNEIFKTFTGQITLTAMGISGNKTYGGGQKVLPNYNNLCITPKISLSRLIKDNKKFVDGTHAGTDIGLMFSVEKIKVYYDQPIMLQCDGECYILCKDHFPLTIERKTPDYKILARI